MYLEFKFEIVRGRCVR